MTTTSDQINVLLIGGGAREHALAQAITKSPKLGTLYATHTQNPGIETLAQPVDIDYQNQKFYRLIQFCDQKNIHLVVIGPEEPLAQGWADKLSKKADGSPRLVFGPSQNGAKLEADKAYAKQIMRAASIPTAEGKTFRDADHADDYMNTRDEPFVVKATGLAKGKGVIVPNTTEEALDAIDQILRKRAFGDAGNEILVEEKLKGTEVSVLALYDGKNILVLPPCQDHKRLLNNDQGPNTGGMGAFCPSGTLSDELSRQIESEVLVPVADALRRDEIDFKGVLYAGIMLTPGGPKVLEFNVRFGDPECQPLLALLQTDALELLTATAAGTLDKIDVQFSNDHAVTVVLATDGYPKNPKIGDVITGIEQAEKLEAVHIHHAATKLTKGDLYTNGGRVLSITATAPTQDQARDRAYEAADLINFKDKQLRTDIAAPIPAKV
ncbi:MAG: phosphoribosylamine--glycine ligase [Phycisphaerales bacterium]|nr:phosphoribosylamine--glycine ligase [Phycisphaerales bacterium]